MVGVVTLGRSLAKISPDGMGCSYLHRISSELNWRTEINAPSWTMKRARSCSSSYLYTMSVSSKSCSRCRQAPKNSQSHFRFKKILKRWKKCKKMWRRSQRV